METNMEQGSAENRQAALADQLLAGWPYDAIHLKLDQASVDEASQKPYATIIGDELLVNREVIKRILRFMALGAKQPPPRHAFEVTIKIGGDDWDYVRRAAQDIADHIGERDAQFSGLSSGGAGGCHSIDVALRDVTPEAYHKELQEWMEKTRQCQQENQSQA